MISKKTKFKQKIDVSKLTILIHRAAILL